MNENLNEATEPAVSKEDAIDMAQQIHELIIKKNGFLEDITFTVNGTEYYLNGYNKSGRHGGKISITIGSEDLRTVISYTVDMENDPEYRADSNVDKVVNATVRGKNKRELEDIIEYLSGNPSLIS